jgi:hypothetical protein
MLIIYKNFIDIHYNVRFFEWVQVEVLIGTILHAPFFPVFLHFNVPSKTRKIFTFFWKIKFISLHAQFEFVFELKIIAQGYVSLFVYLNSGRNFMQWRYHSFSKKI